MTEQVRIPRIKICGITREREAEYLNEYGADYAGFVFYEKSRRSLSIERAVRIAARLDRRIERVAVTVSPQAGLIREIEAAGFDILQVHGAFAAEAYEAVTLPVWRAVNIRDTGTPDEFFRREKKELTLKICGYVADGAGYGAGKTFDWAAAEQTLHSRTAGKRLILAGGLTEENVAEGIRCFRPDVVDVSSGVEEQGQKSREKIKSFIRKVRENEQ